MITTWQAPLADGTSSEELLVTIDDNREQRILIIPALFDEANKMRRQTLQLMRALDLVGCDTFLPDLPGTNESLVSLHSQSLASWRGAIAAAVKHVSATHLFTIRAGCLLAPSDLKGWQYAPLDGPKLLRGLFKARILASREAGIEENSDSLLKEGREAGLMLGGWQLGPEMIAELEVAQPVVGKQQSVIEQRQVGGAGLWLRAEATEDSTQVNALAAILVDSHEGPE